MSFSSSRTFDFLDTTRTDKSSEEIEFHYSFRILIYFFDDLYETYRNFKTTKKLWTTLKDAYGKDNVIYNRWL